MQQPHLVERRPLLEAERLLEEEAALVVLLRADREAALEVVEPRQVVEPPVVEEAPPQPESLPPLRQ